METPQAERPDRVMLAGDDEGRTQMAEPVPLEPTDAELLESAPQALADGHPPPPARLRRPS